MLAMDLDFKVVVDAVSKISKFSLVESITHSFVNTTDRQLVTILQVEG